MRSPLGLEVLDLGVQARAARRELLDVRGQRPDGRNGFRRSNKQNESGDSSRGPLRLSTQSEGRGDVIASSASAIDVVFDLSFVWHQQATSSDIEIWNKRRCVHVISMWDQVDCLHRLAALEHYYRPTVPAGKIASK